MLAKVFASRRKRLFLDRNWIVKAKGAATQGFDVSQPETFRRLTLWQRHADQSMTDSLAFTITVSLRECWRFLLLPKRTDVFR